MPDSRLIKKALAQATPAQLIRVRALVREGYGKYGYDSWAHIYQAALQAFDKGRYGDANILFLLKSKDKELGDALR